jgi:purine-binding chemotaxis protein CheW
MSNELQVVGFRIGHETFALPIAAVHEIVRPPEITAVPHAPEYIEGVINLRGRILPVIDLRRRFGATRIENTRKNRILVVDSEGRLVGLMVDAASEVLKLAPAHIEPPPEVFGDAETNYVTGLAKHQGRLVILVDLKKILQRGELRRLELDGVSTSA